MIIISTKPNLVLVLIGLELLFLAVNVAFIGGALLADDYQGIIYNIYLLNVVAADTSIGLGLVYNFYNLRYQQLAIKK